MAQLKWMVHRRNLNHMPEGMPGRRREVHDHVEVCVHYRQDQYEPRSYTRWDDTVLFDRCLAMMRPLVDCPKDEGMASPRNRARLAR